MAIHPPTRDDALRFLRSWRAPAAVALVLAAAFVWWVVPRRTSYVVSADGGHAWMADDAPAQRRIVWTPAEAVDAGAQESESAALSIGSRRLVEPPPGLGPQVAAGAFLAADGQAIYFASDRSGGHGGYDLYVSRREGDSWLPAENLGSGINGPRDERDPALSPDGLRLYFATDRPVDGVVDPAPDAAAQFDLYVAVRSAPDAAWSPPAPVAEANAADSNETAPYVAGGYLYFASDRPQRAGEPSNDDLFRCLLSGDRLGAIESLGPSINTLFDERLPSVSADGFAIAFVSDRHDALGAQAAYRSAAREVVVRRVWDSSRWQAVLGVWWQALGLTLLVAALAVAVLWGRGWLFEQASAARFFLGSLLLHLVVLALLMAIPLARTIVEQVERIRLEGAELAADNLHQSHRPGEAAYEKVADLESVAEVRTSEVARQIVAPTNVPVPADRPAPTLPAEMVRALPPRHVLIVPPPQPADPPAAAQPLERAAPLDPAEVVAAQMPPEEVSVDREEVPAETPVAPPADAAELARQQAAMPEAANPPLPPRALPAAVPDAIAPEAVAADVAADLPAVAADVPARAGSTEALSAPEMTEAPTAVAAQEAPQETPLTGEVVGPQRAAVDVTSPLRITSAAPRLGDPAPPAVAEMLPDAPLPDPADTVASSESIERVEPAAVATASEPPEAPPQAAPRASAELPEPSPDDAALTAARQAAEAELPARAPAAALPEMVLPDEAEAADTLLAELPSVPAEIAPDGTEVVRASPLPQSPAASLDVEPPPAAPAAKAMPAETGLAAVDAPLPRSDSLPLQLDAATPAEAGGPRAALREDVAVGTLAERALDAPPTLSPIASQLSRPPADALPVAYAEDNVGMRAMFTLRQGDVRREFIELFGGSTETEAAVNRGLVWLAAHQHEDGHWSLNNFAAQCRDHPQCGGHGSTYSDTAATGLALLPFLGTGQTQQSGDPQPTVERGIRWLVEHQKPDGNLFSEPPSNAWMYSHGIAAIALCEAYGLTQDAALREPAQRAVDFIVAAQNQSTGGWRYTPGEAGDTSVVGWQVMALKSAEMAGLAVPPRSLELATAWLNFAEGTGGTAGQFGYTGPGGSLAMTAEGLLCRQFLGSRRDDPSMRAGAVFLAAHLPQPGVESSYYWYYATQVMYHMQAEYWDAWNAALRDTLVATQIKEGPLSGTWEPADSWEQSGGRIYATSLKLLMLEVYYRHLPLYRQLEE